METHEGATGVAEASAQLAALEADREAVAARAMQPWWYDALLSLLLFGFIASYSLRNNWVTLTALVVFLAGCAGLRALYQRITGFWVNGMRPGRTRKAIRVWVVVYAVVLAGAAVAEFLLDLRYAMVGGGVVLGVGVALISRWWSRIYIAELREGL